MLSVSSEFENKISAGARQYVKANLFFADGKTAQLTDTDFMAGSVSYSAGTSSSGKFDIGACVIKSFKFSLNNYSGKFDTYAWAGMRIQPYFGVETSNGTIEYINPDTFYLVSHRTNGSVITCEAYDGMKLLDEGTIRVTENQTALGAVTQCLNAHGLTTNTTTWTGYNQALPAADEMTHRQCLAYIMQLTGHIAIMKRGTMYITEYDKETNVPIRNAVFSEDLHTENLAYTGARYTAEDGTTYTGGTVTGDGAFVYELKEGDNPFIPKAKGSYAIARIWAFIYSYRTYRPGTIEILADPSIEPGDRVTFRHTTSGTTSFPSMIATNFVYKPNTRMRVTFDAEERILSDLRQVNVGHAVYEAKKYTTNELSTYEAAYERFRLLIAETMGLFFTEETQSDGSSILYMHDKQKRADSSTIWKMTANTLSVSTDGGKTFNAAIDSGGNLITNVLYAIKVSADVIEGGILTDATGKNTWNLKTGVLSLTNGIIKDATGNNEWNLQTGDLQMQGEFFTANYNKKSGQWLRIRNGTITGGYNSGTDIDIVAKGTLELAKSMTGFDEDGGSITGDGIKLTGDLIRAQARRFELLNGNNSYVLQMDADNKTTQLTSNFKVHPNYYIRDPKFKFGDLTPDYGISGTYNMVIVKAIGTNGVPTQWNSAGQLVFKNGILIGSKGFS